MPHRYICAVLDEMRECTKSNNYSYLRGLIEEAQVMASRMEEALWEQKDHKRVHAEVKALSVEKKKLEAKVEKLKKKVEKKA